MTTCIALKYHLFHLLIKYRVIIQHYDRDVYIEFGISIFNGKHHGPKHVNSSYASLGNLNTHKVISCGDDLL